MTSPSLGSIAQRPSLRPDLPSRRPPRAGAVNDGRRPPPQAARSVIDRAEHGGSIGPIREYAGATINTVALPLRGRGVRFALTGDFCVQWYRGLVRSARSTILGL